jgi:hypothetical protein
MSDQACYVILKLERKPSQETVDLVGMIRGIAISEAVVLKDEGPTIVVSLEKDTRRAQIEAGIGRILGELRFVKEVVIVDGPYDTNILFNDHLHEARDTILGCHLSARPKRLAGEVSRMEMEDHLSRMRAWAAMGAILDRSDIHALSRLA